MGIHGLTGFIDRNPHLLHDFKLQDSSLVIDGNNFYHFLYYACHVRCTLGGDYDVYRKQVISTFQSFKICGITPYVVLDGAYTVDGRKLNTSLSRAMNRIKSVRHIVLGQSRNLLPPLAYETFIQCLSELGVCFVTCQFEADNEIAVLANKLQCPVMSNDSDFYIFDLSSGFLPMDYVDFHPVRNTDNGSWYLTAQKYHVDDFINSFDGVSRSVLPIFASMLGNDFISASAFETFYARVKAPKIVCKKFSLPPQLSKVLSVLHWLHTKTDEHSNVLEEILNFVHPLKKDHVRKLFSTSVSGYSNVDNFQGCDLYKFFHSDYVHFSHGLCEEFKGFNGAKFPEWFVQAVSRGEITPFILNVAILHRVILLTQVEDLSAPSAFACSTQVRRIMYGILLHDDLSDFQQSKGSSKKESVEGIYSSCCDSQEATYNKSSTSSATGKETVLSKCEKRSGEEQSMESDGLEAKIDEFPSLCSSSPSPSSSLETTGGTKQNCVLEYDRLLKGLKKKLVEPVFVLPDKQHVEGLTAVGKMALPERCFLLLNAVEVQSCVMDIFAEDFQLFVSCLIYWVKTADPKVSVVHVETMIVCVILLHAHYELEKRKNVRRSVEKAEEETRLSEDQEKKALTLCAQFSSMETVDLQQIAHNLEKYHKQAPKFNHKVRYEAGVTHAFAQLQACMLDISNLNKVLRFPLQNIQPSLLFNGTFVYNMYNELKIRPRPDLFLQSMLVKDSPVLKIFLDLKSLLMNFIEAGHFLDPAVGLSKKTRKAKGKKKTVGRYSMSAEDDIENMGDLEESDNSLTTVPGFDVDNKFSLLLLEN